VFFDLHIHSKYSYDSLSSIRGILKTSVKKGLTGIAITDHECFEGSLIAAEMSREYDIMVVPGMEINTEKGDIIGLFIQKAITSRAFNDVVSEIKLQNGIVVLPHPFKRRKQVSESMLIDIDAIEAFNARAQSPVPYNCNKEALHLALSHNLPVVSGSDAHFLCEIGRGAIEFPPVKTLDELRLEIIKPVTRKFKAKPSLLYNEVLSQAIKAYKKRDNISLKVAIQGCYETTGWYLGRRSKNLEFKNQ